MAIGLDEEFDYLDEHKGNEQSVADAPMIKGAKNSNTDDELDDSETDGESTLPEESANKETASELAEEERELEQENFDSSIFVVKVTTNKEDKALELIADKVKKKNIGIYAIARPHGLRGYIFLESPDREHAEEAVFNLPYVKGIIPKVISYEEIQSMIEPVAADINIEKNDIVEIISEPFKKEKAKVVRIDKGKGEAVVSLLGAVVPIPVTVNLDNLRVIRREDEE